MANTIKIKRSSVTVIPSSLAEGELAYSELTGTKSLYIGTNGGSNIEVIGGKKFVDRVNLVTDAEMGYLSGVTASLQTQLNNKQALDSDLTAIAALSGTAGFLTTTGAGSWSVDINSYSLTSHNHNSVYVPFSGGTLTGPLVLSGDPVSGLQAATKQYVDNYALGLDFKQSVKVTTNTNVDLATGGLLTIDGVTLVDGDRVLVKSQATASQNGIYNAHSGSWTRASDADISAEVTSGMFMMIEQGTVYSQTSFVLQTANPITLDTTGLSFVQFGGGISYSSGTGINIVGTVVNIANHSAAYVTSGTMSADRISGGIFGTSDGSAITNLTAGFIATGTLSDSRLSANVLLNSSIIDGGTF